MNNQDFSPISDKPTRTFSIRDLMAIVFRHKRIAKICFFGVLAGALLFAFVVPPYYSATTKFFVERTRADAAVSPLQNSPIAMSVELTEEDLNSEVGLLQDADVLRKVVTTCGLDQHKLLSEYIFGPATPEKKLAKAVKRLASNLTIEAEKKANLIDVTYTSTDPQLAARVLTALGDAYIQKHMQVHSPPGQVLFFSQETDRYRKQLADASDALKEFSKEVGGVTPTVARDLFMQKLAEFHLGLQQTRAQLAATEERIKMLQKQAGTTPERLTTEMREEDDAQVLQGLKNTLMTLSNKRTELLTKYQPDYPLVVEVDKEIKDTKASIVAEEAKPIKEQTTDRNPTYAWVDSELTKAKADYSGLKAQEAAMQNMVDKYGDQVRQLTQKGLVEQDLQRNYKASEDSYLLYLRKREEARMADALDSTRIVNVAMAETPVAPALPMFPPLLVMVLGTIVAGAVAAGGVFVKEHFDPSFRTPTDVASELDIPLLATVPHEYEASQATGTNGGAYGRGRGRDLARAEASDSVLPIG